MNKRVMIDGGVGVCSRRSSGQATSRYKTMRGRKRICRDEDEYDGRIWGRYERGDENKVEVERSELEVL